ncbi:ribose 5-phosphate isomerase A [Enterococcus sp. AZ109]|uniref:ribose 5-phosphate isomerase A n=1 Tax=Enterococcus sp. AZ109 TaxID=2774634 RepID=UPI003F201DDA
MKKRSALRALELIEDGMIVGLGGGSTISHLIHFMKEENKQVKIVTPSFTTANLCLEAGLTILPTYLVSHIDIAFDGCDEVDQSLNALKSGGGIHTQEKIVASLAKDYILLVDESKFFEELPFKVPIVLEVIPEARMDVANKMNELGASIVERKCSAKDGITRSDNGNLILDVQFKPHQDLETLNRKLQQTVGVVEISLFYQVATKIIVATETTTELIERNG